MHGYLSKQIIVVGRRVNKDKEADMLGYCVSISTRSLATLDTYMYVTTVGSVLLPRLRLSRSRQESTYISDSTI